MKYLSDLQKTIEIVVIDYTRNHQLGLSSTVSGYGSKTPSRYKVKLDGEKILRRVYVRCYSNVGTSYIIIKGEKYIVDFNSPE